MGRPPIVHIPMFIHWFFDIRLQEFDGCNCVKTIAEASLNYTDMFRHQMVLYLQKKIDARIGAKERVSELKSSAFWPKLRGSDCSKKDVDRCRYWISMAFYAFNYRKLRDFSEKKRWPKNHHVSWLKWLGPDWVIYLHEYLHITSYISTYGCGSKWKT